VKFSCDVLGVKRDNRVFQMPLSVGRGLCTVAGVRQRRAVITKTLEVNRAVVKRGGVGPFDGICVCEEDPAWGG
jgi:hypothetical protein